MPVKEFKGFAGARLCAEESGADSDPAVLLLHGAGQTHEAWCDVASTLVSAGRKVVSLDLRGHGASDRARPDLYRLDAYMEDIRLVLSQMQTRPVIIGATFGGWLACAALANGHSHLASGLVLVDAPPDVDRIAAEKVKDALLEGLATDPARAAWDPGLLLELDIDEILQKVSDGARSIDIPVLFVRGTQSEMTQAQVAMDFVASFPDAEYAEIPRANYQAAFDRTDSFNGLLLDFLERRAPRYLPEYQEGSDARTLRDAMGCFATGITVVTAITQTGVPVGLTANSFSSVSLDPPLLLVCISKAAGSVDIFRHCCNFAVNVLHIGQQPISDTFARPGQDRFAKVDWTPGTSSLPLIDDAIASFECQATDCHEAGDHLILVGQVLRAKYDPRRDPLLYFKGRYRRLHF